MIQSLKNIIINEDYFSKLANRKDNNIARMENEVTEEFVREYIADGFDQYVSQVDIKKLENGMLIVDIVGNFVLRRDVEELPFYFGKVTGDFDATKSLLKSLKGCPREVGNHFHINACKHITSLEGGPVKVGGKYSCEYCENLESLKGCAKNIGKNFSCGGCKKLKSLEGLPFRIKLVNCSGSGIESLKGCPMKMHSLSINNCENLKSLYCEHKIICDIVYYNGPFTKEQIRSTISVSISDIYNY